VHSAAKPYAMKSLKSEGDSVRVPRDRFSMRMRSSLYYLVVFCDEFRVNYARNDFFGLVGESHTQPGRVVG